MKLTRLIYIGIVLGLLHSHALFAQNNSKIADSRKATSLSEDQIDHHAQITTNYELRASYNDNQGDDFGCRLMMNPSVEGVGEAIERSITSETKLLRPTEFSDLENEARVERYSVSPSAAIISDHQISDIASSDEKIKLQEHKRAILSDGVGKVGSANETDILPPIGKTPQDVVWCSKEASNKASEEYLAAETVWQQVIEELLPFTLEDFRNAVANYPEAQRIIIVEEEGSVAIHIRNDADNHSDKNDDENQKTMRMIKDLITAHYSLAVANNIPELNQMAFIRAKALSAEKIREILSRVDNSNNVSSIERTTENCESNKSDDLLPRPPLYKSGQKTAFNRQNIDKTKEEITSPKKFDLAVSLSISRATEEQTDLQKTLFKKVQRDNSDMSHFYKDVDLLWLEAKKAWDDRTTALWKKEAQEKILKEVCDFKRIVKEKIATAEAFVKKYDPIFSKIEKVANYLEKFDTKETKRLSAAMTISKDILAQSTKIVKEGIPVALTIKKFLAQINVRRTIATFEIAKEKAAAIESNANRQESIAQTKEADATLELAQILKVSHDLSKESDLREWITKAKLSEDNNSLIDALVSEGISNPSSINQAITAAWADRMNCSQKYTEQLKDKTALPVRELDSFYKNFSSVKKKIKELQASNTITQKELQKAAQNKKDLESKLEEANQKLDQLELETKAPDSISETINTISKLCEELKTASSDLQSAEEKSQSLQPKITAMQVEAKKYRKVCEDAEKIYDRNIVRAAAHAAADRGEALTVIWPEKALKLALKASLKFQVKAVIKKFFLSNNNKETTIGRTVVAPVIDKSYEIIEPPLRTDEEWESIGREILGLKKKDSSPEIGDPIQEAVFLEIMTDGLQETDANIARWEAFKELYQSQTEKKQKIIVVAREQRALNASLSSQGNNETQDDQSINETSSTGTASTDSSIMNWFNDAMKTMNHGARSIFEEVYPFKMSEDKKREDWNSLADQKDKERIKNGGAKIPWEIAREFWYRADEAALKRETIKEAKKICAIHAKRWLAMAEYDEAQKKTDNTSKEAMIEIIEQSHKKICFDDNDSKTADTAVAAVAEGIRADKLEKEWVKEAMEYLHSDPNQEQKDEAIKIAQNKLKEDDIAVLNFLEMLLSIYSSSYEPPMMYKERITKEAREYEKQVSSLAEIFNSLDISKNATTIKDDSRVDNQYEEKALELALKGARGKIYQAAMAWKKKSEQSANNVKIAEANLKEFEPASNESQKAQKDLDRATTIARIDKKALEILKQEAARLAPIETALINYLETEAKITKEKEEEAAKSYFKGKGDSCWFALTAQERSDYNMAIRVRHQIINKAAEEEINSAKRIMEQLKEETNEIQNSFLLFVLREIQEAAEYKLKYEQAEAKVVKLQEAEEERQKAIRWAQLTVEERKAELDKEQIELSWVELNSRINKLSLGIKFIYEYGFYHEKIFNYIKKANKAVIDEKSDQAELWKKAAVQMDRAYFYAEKASKIKKSVKTAESSSWSNAGNGFFNAAEKLEKAIEVEIAGKPAIALKYREAAEQQASSVEYYIKSAIAYGVGKTAEGKSWEKGGISLQSKAFYDVKAIEAEEAGK
ncbi:MAG TPA: hypothetical protein VJK54_02035, partial [Chthoniobacterales bacterium]|nr:hypothetical protein [Chthoniobacterales bacterium]